MDTPPPASSRVPRLRQWYWKFAYIVVAITIYYLGGALAPTDNSRGILRSAMFFVLVLLATRLFRGATEPGPEPRPWWRMTGRPLAGFVLGGILAFATIALVLYAYGIETEKAVAELRPQEPYVIVTAVLFGTLAVLYLTSSIRIRGLDRDARIDEAAGRNGSRTSSTDQR